MSLLTQIALLAGLIAGSALLWLVGRAFRKHAAWGLAVLLLFPVTAVLFGIRHWREEKGPFLVYLTAFTAAMVIGSYVIGAKGGWNTVKSALRAPQQVFLPAFVGSHNLSFVPASLKTVRKAAAADRASAPLAKQSAQAGQPSPIRHDPPAPRTATASQAVPERTKPAVKSAKSTLPLEHYRAAYVPIDPADAAKYLGMTVKVKRLNRPEQDCVLRGISPAGLSFEQHSRGGTFAFKYRATDIEKLRVLVKQEY
jgi:hypothetical protein